jgi:uncharacterized protein (TIGR02246 family)
MGGTDKTMLGRTADHRRATIMTTASKALADEAIKAFTDDWNAAGRNWDAEKFKDLFWEDAQFFGGRPVLLRGQEEIKGYYAWSGTMLSSATIDLFDVSVLEITPDAVMISGFMNFNATAPNGNPMKIVNRMSLLHVRKNGRWRVQQMHLSTRQDRSPIER